MDKVERVYRVLSLEEPDKVPKGELGIHDELISAILGKNKADRFEDQVRIRNILKIDIVNTGLEGGPKPELIGKSEKGYPIYRDWLGNEWTESGKTKRTLKYGLSTLGEYRSFKMPDTNLYHTSNVKRWSSQTDTCVFAQIGGVFDSLYLRMGLANYIKMLYLHPNLLKNIIEEVYKFDLQIIKMYADAGAHVILVGDDLAYDNGPFISVEHMRRYVFPYLAGEALTAHRLGLPAMLHCDGNINSLLEDIVKSGFDGLHSIQPSAGVDIVAVKRDWGDRLCLMGNLDLDYLLTLGASCDVQAEVKRLIREVAPGGGYILSTTNVLTRYTKPENALVMYETAEKYGRYQ